MSAKHTPGPWTLTENKNRTHNGSWFEIDGEMTRIAEIPASTNPMWDFVSSYRNGIANARLIAAAPDLLDALRQWAHAVAIGDEVELINASAARDAAIAKATGEEK